MFRSNTSPRLWHTLRADLWSKNKRFSETERKFFCFLVPVEVHTFTAFSAPVTHFARAWAVVHIFVRTLFL